MQHSIWLSDDVNNTSEFDSFFNTSFENGKFSEFEGKLPDRQQILPRNYFKILSENLTFIGVDQIMK